MSDELRAFPSLIALGDELERAGAGMETAGRSRGSLRGRALALAIAGGLVLAASAAAGTLLVLRGSVIPAPDERVVGPAQSPIPGSGKVQPFRAPDPGGAPPWTVRVSRSKTGLTCTTVGQVRGGRFGLVGLDGRFRTVAEGVVDGCGQIRPGEPLIGARVFDASRRSNVRTVVAGDAGPTLRDIVVVAGGRSHEVARAADGSFAVALRGYPEDLGLAVTLRFANGTVRRYPFGRSSFVVADPLGKAAWKLEAGQLGQPDGQPAPRQVVLCVQFRTARNVPRPAVSPGACGRVTGVKAGSGTRNGLFFQMRRITARGDRRGLLPFGQQLWHGHPPRTAVWGFAGTDIRAVFVTGPDGTRQMDLDPTRLFLAVYPPSVDPGSLSVRVIGQDGSERRYTRSHGLVAPPGSTR